MIAPLRRTHFRILVALAAFLPVAFAASWLSRPDRPVAALAPFLSSREAELVWSDEALFGAVPITTRVLRAATEWIVELVPREDLLRPDVLVYWSPDAGGKLESGTHFLGRLGGTRAHRFALPAGAVFDPGRDPGNAEGPAGALFLYSLGHQELIDRAVLNPGPESARP